MCGAMLPPCLLFAICKLTPGVYRLYGRAIGELQKGHMPIRASQDCCRQCPCPCSRPLLTHTSTKDPQTLTVKSISVSCGVTALFIGSWCAQDFVCALCFLQSCGSSVIKSHCPSSRIPWGFPVFLLDPPCWEDWCGAQNLHKSARTSLVLLFSSF